MSRSPSRQKSLYDRLGGIFAIAAVVDLFSELLYDNPVVGVNSKNEFLRDWHRNKIDRLPGLKWLRCLWLSSLSGGPYTYIGTKPGKCPFSLENAHKAFEISPEEFDAVGYELGRALDYYKVPVKEKKEVMAAFMSHKYEINYGFFIANDLPHKSIKC